MFPQSATTFSSSKKSQRATALRELAKIAIEFNLKGEIIPDINEAYAIR